MTAFCDWLTVTVSRDNGDAVRDAVFPVLDAAGFSCVAEGPGPGVSLHQCETQGTVRIFPQQMVLVLSASGQACAHMRSLDLWGEYLMALGTVPHRVTTLHATIELLADAPPVLEEIAARGHAGTLALSRKVVPGHDVREYRSAGPDGRLTGTVYIGGRKARVQGVVYDKRNERWAKLGIDPGPLLRFEMRLKSDTGVTLRDAFDVSPVFYHYASPALLARPPGVVDWVGHAEGFMLPARRTFTPAELMARKLETSPDVDRLLQLAAQCGPYGLDLLVQRLKRRAAVVAGGGLAARSDAPAASAVSGGVQ